MLAVVVQKFPLQQSFEEIEVSSRGLFKTQMIGEPGCKDFAFENWYGILKLSTMRKSSRFPSLVLKSGYTQGRNTAPQLDF